MFPLLFSSIVIILIILLFIVVHYFVNFAKKKSKKEEKVEEKTKRRERICCIYAYYEKDEQYRQNFRYFLDHAIFDSIDFVLVVNGICTVKIPQRPNIRVLYRENVGYDFGGYAHGLASIQKDNYDYFFFVNTSVIGPIMRPGEDRSTWPLRFIELFQGDIHLVGVTINICESPWVASFYQYPLEPITHVQSYFFVLDRPAIDLLEHFVFNTSQLTRSMEETIIFREVWMSQILLKHGWNISCIAKKYQNQDYRILKYNINWSSQSSGGDPVYTGHYFGATLDPYDILFIKTNRGLF